MITPSRGQNPFAGNPGKELHFWDEVDMARQGNLVPSGYGLHLLEPSYSEFDEVAEIYLGRQKEKRKLTVKLPREIWKPRLILWIQSLEIMYRMIDE